MKILITGFEPFGGETVNPALDAVRALPDEIRGVRIIKTAVPVVYEKDFETVQAVFDREQPDAVILIGQAGGRKAVTPETTAVNIKKARIPDNAGNMPDNEPVNPNGPGRYASTLPVEALVETLSDHALPAEISNSAGTFVCNDLFYRVMDYLKDRPGFPAGFVHVPYSEEQLTGKAPDTPFIPLSDITEALYLILGTVIETALRGA